MQRLRLIWFIIIVLIGCGNDSTGVTGNTAPLSISDQQSLLDAHNEERKLYPGVPPLTWSPELAKFAQAWADHLVTINKLEHSSEESRSDKSQTGHNGPVGENLWMGQGSNPNHIFPLKEMVKDWINEKADYNYTDNKCSTGKVCGHYTQAVWKDSTLVGCGKARKEHAAGVVVTLSCNYSPAGNIVGKWPY